MFYPSELLNWVEQVSTHFPQLTPLQAQVVAWYSFAVTLVQSCGMSHVSYLLARLFNQPENTVRQRLREALYDAADKRGAQRRDLDVVICFAPLLQWVLSLCHPDDERIWLALDATTLRQTFTVLSVSVLMGGCAIPVAWAILPATQPGAWKPHWLGLLAALDSLCPDQPVMVLADRGLYAKWLFDAIVARGWHPLLRINPQGSVCLRDSGQRLPLAYLRRQCRGHTWHGRAICFTGQQQLVCTLLVQWDAPQQDAWLLVTDLRPAHVSPSWYTLRMWIEAGFKALKSATFHWERTRMTDPARTERLWLVLALAGLRTALLAPPLTPVDLSSAPLPARLNLFKRGLLAQLADLLMQRPLSFYPLHMPTLPPPPYLEFATLLDTYP